jgi:hypothetical protein
VTYAGRIVSRWIGGPAEWTNVGMVSAKIATISIESVMTLALDLKDFHGKRNRLL